MAWQDDFQDAVNVVGEVGKYVDKFFPSGSVSVPDTAPPPEPIAAKPVLGAAPLTLGSPLVIVAGLVIVYYFFVK